ncbi:hypothetical protein SAMN05444157_0649 [Frankineae bacterium MT45]|nr:hypothetical protein SAMN05444157_0649 [Frankineae bacterium MT45]
MSFPSDEARSMLLNRIVTDKLGHAPVYDAGYYSRDDQNFVYVVVANEINAATKSRLKKRSSSGIEKYWPFS